MGLRIVPSETIAKQPVVHEELLYWIKAQVPSEVVLVTHCSTDATLSSSSRLPYSCCQSHSSLPGSAHSQLWGREERGSDWTAGVRGEVRRHTKVTLCTQCQVGKGETRVIVVIVGTKETKDLGTTLIQG